MTATEIEKIIDKALDKAVQKSAVEFDKRMQRYIGGLSEDFQHKIDLVLEVVKPLLHLPEKVAHIDETVQEIKVTLDATFEAVGNHEERITVLEEKVR